MKKKFYTVWNGLTPGVYDSWEACKQEIHGVPNARYKSYATREEALDALHQGYVSPQTPKPLVRPTTGNAPYIIDSVAVDAACSGNPGKVEYRGVSVKDGTQLFKVGPLEEGTNNIGEFLALVHALAFLEKQNCPLPIYSDSRNAIAWVKHKKCKTQLAPSPLNKPLFNLIERAEYWLQTHAYTNQILKWETALWGEIPADFGRK